MQDKTVYIDNDTGKPIVYQTYRAFAQGMVERWMASKGHRENILEKLYSRIGIGVAKGMYQGLPAIYVTQNFWGTIDPITYIKKQP